VIAWVISLSGQWKLGDVLQLHWRSNWISGRQRYIETSYD